MKQERLLIIIPAYNEAENIAKTLASVSNADIPMEYDTIVINDASLDHTLDILRELKAPHIDLPVNLGIGGAVQTGFKYAAENDYDYALQLDGDGQHPAEYIKKLLENRKGYDVVIGSRYLKKEGFQSSFQRRIGIKLLKGYIKLLCGVTIHDVTSGFRLYNKKAIKVFASYYPDDYPEPEAIVHIARNSFLINEIAVSMIERQGGESSINTRSSFFYMYKVMLAITFEALKNH